VQHLSVLLVEVLLGLAALLLLVPVSVVFAQVLTAMPGLRRQAMQMGRRPSIAVLIPAHDEALGIASTVRTIKPQLAATDRLLVVADNCTDETARIAAEAGAEVLQRSNHDLRGKGYALEAGMRYLETSPPETVVVLDADCRVDSGGIERLARLCFETGRPVQGLDLMLTPKGGGLKTRVMEFAWLVRNHVRVLGWHRLGLPCHLMGTGMAFSWPLVKSTQFASGHIVEDRVLGVALARAGAPPLFCPEARVTSYFPRTSSGIVNQRTRWEHGQLEMVLSAAPRLVVEALGRRDRNLLALALDLSVPPLALLALTALSLFVVSAAFATSTERFLPLLLASMSIVMLGVAVLLSWARFGREIVSFADLAFGPVYALWKLPLYLKFMFRRQRDWVRATRDGD
jgi:cellulose synthase/poly-beta-1,6-N-acetylglucosamine synthase-like glycosyltransferase